MIVGSLCYFTNPANKQSQKKFAESGLIPLLVQFLDTGTGVTKRKAAISLAHLSKASIDLTRPIPNRGLLFQCFSPPSESKCPVHQGICNVEPSFCLVSANVVPPLVTLLGDSDCDVCEASLDALLTFIEAEQLQYRCKVLGEANAIPEIIKLLNSSNNSNLQEKVLGELERIFRLVEYFFQARHHHHHQWRLSSFFSNYQWWSFFRLCGY